MNERGQMAIAEVLTDAELEDEAFYAPLEQDCVTPRSELLAERLKKLRADPVYFNEALTEMRPRHRKMLRDLWLTGNVGALGAGLQVVVNEYLMQCADAQLAWEGE